MPARQRGSVVKKGAGWQARWYDEHGQRRAQSGFETKSAAREWVDSKVDTVLALRRGDLPASDQIPTVNELVDRDRASVRDPDSAARTYVREAGHEGTRSATIPVWSHRLAVQLC
jgi:hypothetical protein